MAVQDGNTKNDGKEVPVVTLEDQIRNALAQIETGEIAENQVAILYHRNIACEKITEVWAGRFNDDWAARVNEKLEAGFQIMRIQTEWHGTRHETMIYMVKLSES